MSERTPETRSAPAPDQRDVQRRDPDPLLFRPIRFRSVELRNRIMLSPMCQYSAAEGVPNDWHLMHLGARAAGGAGLVCTEATHVVPEGRITPNCLGLWNDDQEAAFARIVALVAGQGAVPAIQIGHAGRKASTAPPWEGRRPLGPDAGGWAPRAPSAVAYRDGAPVPRAMSLEEVRASIQASADSARRARRAGFRALELHGAHGYLIHSFLSPLSNRRDDAYGGGFDNRIRFLMETVEAVRGEWPEELPLFVRISCTDWVDGGWDLAQSIRLARALAQTGQVDLIDCSSGGNDPRQQIPRHPGYQVPFAEAIRRESGLATGALGLISRADMAEEILANGRADLVVLGRALLADPHWPINAAKALRIAPNWPVQYERADVF
jgi:2,4-dienoyl-CoA reductase-like NADH-dependent reductase (Old Yellow Enzyme family)